MAPSLGASSSQFFNLGQVRNHGFELAIDARIDRRPSFAWDLTLSGSATSNKVLELGAGVSRSSSASTSGTSRAIPLGGYWAVRPGLR